MVGDWDACTKYVDAVHSSMLNHRARNISFWVLKLRIATRPHRNITYTVTEVIMRLWPLYFFNDEMMCYAEITQNNQYVLWNLNCNRKKTTIAALFTRLWYQHRACNILMQFKNDMRRTLNAKVAHETRDLSSNTNVYLWQFCFS